MIAAQENAKLAVPSNPQDWLADRKARLTIALKRLARLPVTALFRTVA
jgi:hypothetical protein